MSLCSILYRSTAHSHSRAYRYACRTLATDVHVLPTRNDNIETTGTANMEQAGPSSWNVDTKNNQPFPAIQENASSSKSKRTLGTLKKTKAAIAKPWDGLTSMAHVFAIVREIERRFGPVREYRLIRDYEISTQYQNYFFFMFESQESADRMGETAVLEVPEPDVDIHKFGGVGLEDVQDLLHPAEYDPTLNYQEKQQKVYISHLVQEMGEQGGKGKVKDKDKYRKETFSVKLELMHSHFRGGANKVINNMLPTAAKMRATAHAYLAWGGGFYDDVESRTTEHSRALTDAIVRNKRLIGPAMAAVYEPKSKTVNDDVTGDQEEAVDEDDRTEEVEAISVEQSTSSPSEDPTSIEAKPHSFLRIDEADLAPVAPPSTTSSINDRVTAEQSKVKDARKQGKLRQPSTQSHTQKKLNLTSARSPSKEEKPLSKVRSMSPESIPAKSEENDTIPSKEPVSASVPPADPEEASKKEKRDSFIQRMTGAFRGRWL